MPTTIDQSCEHRLVSNPTRCGGNVPDVVDCENLECSWPVRDEPDKRPQKSVIAPGAASGSPRVLTHRIEFDAELCGVGRVVPTGVPACIEANARLAWDATPAATFEFDGFNLPHAYHLEVFDPSTSPNRHIPRAVFSRMRASF